jgi:uncharacterized protein YecE (DUF72 family)
MDADRSPHIVILFGGCHILPMQQPFLITGTSGFSYAQWKGLFYPKSTQQLEYYAEHFDSVEINSSFYRLPTPELLKRWKERTPDSFLFAMKAWRGITHDGRLQDLDALEKFMAMLPHLGGKCGPILFQLPASLPFEEPVLQRFLNALSKRHQYALEPRHESWQDDRAHGLLFEHNVALVHAHMKGWSPRAYTASFAYLRMHGTRAMYKGSYVDAFLKQLSYDLHHHALERAYVYFNNTMEGTTALDNAHTLSQLSLLADAEARRHG